MNFSLEICVDSVESAIIAQNAGADRVELCSDLPEGGTTPGIGTISSARDNLTIGLHVIIRPRAGDFMYTDLEYEIMRREIDICGEAGVNGIVLGILESDGAIDLERTSRLIEFARPMSATFHRSFDMCIDPVKGLEDVIASGADRLLTSGLKNKAFEGREMIRELIRQAGKRIIVMPGSGINELNIAEIALTTGASEFHLTGRKTVESEMLFRRADISMGNTTGIPEFLRKVADLDQLIRIINILKNI